ncbi:MAG: chromosomal replication initiator protein DnaA [Anaerolineae bacterium]
MSPETAWKATLGELELQMTKATFNTWLKDTRLLACEDDEFIIGVRNDYAKDWLENRLHDTVLRTLSAMVGREVSLRFVVWSDELIAQPPPVLKNGKNHARNTAAGNIHTNTSDALDGRLNNRFSFSTFVVGPSNRLAHAAALSVSENPGQTYNPLFIYGGVGLGKTHLLHAIGHKCLGNGYRVCYISSETFTNDLVQSIRNKKMAEFREKYRTPDILLMDDVQFIAGKESTQEEMFHTFNDLHSQGKQVVLSSDRPPKAMVTLEERLQSRFEWGLMADIQLPDIETRKAILQSKAEDSGVQISEHVVDSIAHYVRNNIRELEGALNKVIAYAQLAGGVIDGELVNMALADLMRKPEQTSVAQVIDAVCNYYSVSPDALFSTSRSRTIAFPRQVVMYLARTETDASLPQIGAQLGNRDHTTVLYGYEKIASLMETNSSARRDILEIKAALYETADTPARV